MTTDSRPKKFLAVFPLSELPTRVKHLFQAFSICLHLRTAMIVFVPFGYTCTEMLLWPYYHVPLEVRF